MKNNLWYYIAFSHCMGIGPHRFDLLLKHFKEIEKAYKAEKKELDQLLGSSWSDKFIQFRSEFDYENKLEEIKAKGIAVLKREDKHFPRQLREIPDPPICLYVKGDIKSFDFDKQYLLAVVGTRKPTSYGIQVVKKLTFDLATAGFVIVSGMAIGIDAAAHQAALEAKAQTIAILGCGVDLPNPPSNRFLYEKIIKSGGLVMSEFPPGMMSLKGLFIARNRLISGISKGVLVVEGAKDSGALTTARFAAEQGREVFAPPGPITSRMSEAPNLLIKEGARIVTSLEDILSEFNLKITPKRKEDIGIELGKDERMIVELLGREPKGTDEISFIAKTSTSNVLQILSALEVRGIVEKNQEGKYQLR